MIIKIWSFLPDGANAALQVGGVPENDGGNDEAEPAGAIALLVETPVPDFTEPVEEDRSREGIAGLAFVEPGVNTAAQLCALQPRQNKQGALDPPHFTESQGKPVLPGIGGQLSKNERRGDRTLPDGGGQAQQVFPMGLDVGEIDFSSDERL